MSRFDADDPVSMCHKNAAVAAALNRPDLVQVKFIPVSHLDKLCRGPSSIQSLPAVIHVIIMQLIYTNGTFPGPTNVWAAIDNEAHCAVISIDQTR